MPSKDLVCLYRKCTLRYDIDNTYWNKSRKNQRIVVLLVSEVADAELGILVGNGTDIRSTFVVCEQTAFWKFEMQTEVSENYPTVRKCPCFRWNCHRYKNPRPADNQFTCLDYALPKAVKCQ